MLNSKLLALKVQTFINRHLNANVHDLALKGSPFSELETAELMQQIQSKNKCKKKQPTWFNSLGIYYPAKLNIEQTSSEKTALYKSAMVEGELLIDLSGGFGVDSFYFSKKITKNFFRKIANLFVFCVVVSSILSKQGVGRSKG